MTISDFYLTRFIFYSTVQIIYLYKYDKYEAFLLGINFQKINFKNNSYKKSYRPNHTRTGYPVHIHKETIFLKTFALRLGYRWS